MGERDEAIKKWRDPRDGDDSSFWLSRFGRTNGPSRQRLTRKGNAGEHVPAAKTGRRQVAKRMRTGNVTINGNSHFGITSPFGGTKQSGLGYRNGEEGY